MSLVSPTKPQLFVFEKCPDCQQCVITAKYAGIPVEIVLLKKGDNRKREFAQLSPLGSVPVYKDENGVLFQSQTIVKYFASIGNNPSLLGTTEQQKEKENPHFVSAQISQWIEFCFSDLHLPQRAWILPILGAVPHCAEATKRAKSDVNKVLGVLNDVLSKSDFLVGKQLTIADIVAVCQLWQLFTMTLDEKTRSPFPFVTKWFTKIVELPFFVEVFGKTELCVKALVAQTLATETNTSPSSTTTTAAATSSSSSSVLKNKKKVDPVKLSKQVADEELLVEKIITIVPENCSFKLEHWKRIFTNELFNDETFPALWKSFNESEYSFYFCSFKQHTQITSSQRALGVIDGLFTKMNAFRSFCFSSMCTIEEKQQKEEKEESCFAVEGIWILPTNDADNLIQNVERLSQFVWGKLSIKSETTKKTVYDYLTFDFKDSPSKQKGFVQGKTFK